MLFLPSGCQSKALNQNHTSYKDLEDGVSQQEGVKMFPDKEQQSWRNQNLLSACLFWEQSGNYVGIKYVFVVTS